MQKTRRSKPQSKQTRIGPLKHGDLIKHGYESVITKTKNERHKSLEKAVQEYGSLTVWKKLNVLFILHKNSNPSLSTLFLKDRNWIRSTYGIKAEPL